MSEDEDLVSTAFQGPLGSDLDPGSGGLQARLPVPRKTLRFESLGPWALPREVCRSLGPEGQAMPRGVLKALSADSQSRRRASAQGTQLPEGGGGGGG